MAPVPIRDLPDINLPLDPSLTDFPLGEDGGLATQKTAKILLATLFKILPAADPIADITALRAINEDTIKDGQSVLVLDSYIIYIYHATSIDADDGSSRIRPDFVTPITDPGRWHSFTPGGCDDYSRIMTSPNGEVLVNQNGFVLSAPCT